MSNPTARDLWVTIKTAAVADGRDLAEGLKYLALEVWGASDAHTKVGHVQADREAFIASFIGAAVVDTQIEKLALSREDKEYLLHLNAVAALEDLAQFSKSASLLATLAKHPALVGAALGGVGGAGFGAYMDDENRARGALRFGIPGAIGGAIVGHGIHQMRAEDMAKAEEAVRNKARDAREVESHAMQKKLHETRLQQEQLKLYNAEQQAQQNWMASAPPPAVTP